MASTSKLSCIDSNTKFFPVDLELVSPSTQHLDVINELIETKGDCFRQISRVMWENPEIAYEEFLAHDMLTAIYGDYGFRVHERYHLPTCFKAEYNKLGRGEIVPTIGFICEYDALPEIGHACGHNLVTEASLIASFALKDILESDPMLKGRIIVIGTCAAEDKSTKLKMLNAHLFEEIDILLMAHPGKNNQIIPWFDVPRDLTVQFIGLPAHAHCFPYEGINAVDSAAICCHNMDMEKKKVRPEQRIRYMILEGGDTPATVPDSSVVMLSIYSKKEPELELLTFEVERCCEAAADATGCELKYRLDETAVDAFKTCEVLAYLYHRHAKSYGMDFSNATLEPYWLSKDIGNVSQQVPAIRPLFSIETDAEKHTEEFAEASNSEVAQQCTFAVGKALAVTGLDILLNPLLILYCKKQIRPKFLDSIFGRRGRFSCLNSAMSADPIA